MKRKPFFILFLTVCAVSTLACGLLGTPAAPTAAPASATTPPEDTLTPRPATPTSLPSLTPPPPEPTPSATSAAAQPPRPADAVAHLPSGEPLTIREIHMASESSGWAVATGVNDVNDHLLRTEDGGSTWSDRTPPVAADPSAARLVATGFYLDAERAWVIFHPMDNPPVTSTQIWFTIDGGQKWNASAALDMGQGAEAFAPDVLTFPDAQHGWFLTHVGAGMHHDYIFLFATADGGLNWTRIADPWTENFDMVCSKTGLVFNNPQSGWVTGDCYGVSPNFIYFYHTPDGGKTWNAVTLPVPADTPDLLSNEKYMCGAYNPVFSTELAGSLVVKCSIGDPQKPLTWLYTTADGGKIWKAHPAPVMIDSVQFLDSKLGWLLGGKKLFHTVDSGNNWSELAQVNWIGQMDFINLDLGWAVSRAGVSMALVKTSSGGKLWEEIKPVIK